MNLTTKQLKQIIKEELSKLLNEVDWFNSPDFDYPAEVLPKGPQRSSRVVVFSADDRYDVAGDTHGRDSHAIKHLHEMDPPLVQNYAKEALKWLQNEHEGDVYIITKESSTPQPINKSDVTLGDMVNLFDHINDKMLEDGGGIPNYSEPEGIVYGRFLAPMVGTYERRLSNLMNSAIEVSDDSVGSESLLKYIITTKRPVISFMAKFQGDLKQYWLDTRTSDLASKAPGKGLATFMRIQDKRKPETTLVKALQDLRSNRAMVLEPEYSILQVLIDKIYGDHKAQQAADEERKRAEKAAAKAAAAARRASKPKKKQPKDVAKQLMNQGQTRQQIDAALIKQFPHLATNNRAINGIMNSVGIP